MERFVAAHPDLRLSCLPSTESGHFALELGIRGPAAAVEAGMAEIRRDVEALGFPWEPVDLSRREEV